MNTLSDALQTLSTAIYELDVEIDLAILNAHEDGYPTHERIRKAEDYLIKIAMGAGQELERAKP